MTWVPPAYRQPGDAPRPPPPRRPRSRAWFPLVGAAATGAAVVGAVFATSVVSWLDSVCNDPAEVVAAHRGALRLHLVMIWVLAAGVPLVVAGLARARKATSVPWVIAAVALVAVGLGMALTAQPSTWCLF